MANNRLYIVNIDKNEYCCIGKHDGISWGLGNVDVLKELLEDSWDFSDKTPFIIVSEKNTDLYNKYILNGYNLNGDNKWEYYENDVL